MMCCPIVRDGGGSGLLIIMRNITRVMKSILHPTFPFDNQDAMIPLMLQPGV